VEVSSVTLKDNSFTILIDGKPSGMRPDELTQLPANLLQNIEVITNPSVRYSSEGLGGVINLKMKKAKEGFNGMVQVSGGTNAKANGIVTLNYKTKKVNMFLNVWDRYEGGRTESTYKVSNTDSSYLSQNFQNKLSRNMLCSKLGLDYDINANNFLSFYWLSYYKKGKGSSLFQEQFSSPILEENKEIKKAVRDGLFDNEIALNYTYQKKRDFLTVDLTYFNQNQPNIFEYLEKDQITFSQNIDFFKSYYSASVYYSRNLATFWKIYDFKLETGLSAESDNQKINNSLSTIDNNKKKTVDYVSQKMAGFLQLSVGSPKVGINAGLKVNYFDNSVNLQDSLLDHQKFPYIISGVSIYYKPFSVLEMSIGQSSRISTPYLLQINPLFFFDEYTYTRNTGNPHLLPATTNSWEFNINYSDEKGWKAYATLGYMSTKNDFTQTYFEEEGNYYTSWDNIAKSKAIFLNANASYRIFKFFKAGIAFDLRNDIFQAKGKETASYINYDIKAILDFNFKKNFRINIMGTYYPKTYSYTSSRDDYFDLRASVSKTFGKFTLSLAAYNILGTYPTVNAVGKDFTSTTFVNLRTQSIHLGVMYLFGNEIKTRAPIDLNTGGLKMED
ncbi:MAG: outer membrane beta-barrel protein, partial [Bacteroidales bacterium]